MLVLIISLLIFFAFTIYLLIEELTILQAQFYELKRYFLYKNKKINKKKLLFYLLLIILLVATIFMFMFFDCSYLNIVFTFILIPLFYKPHAKKIVKFKYTGRIKRIISIYLFLYLLLSVNVLFLANKYYAYILIIYESLFLSLFELIVSLTMTLDKPIETIINSIFKSKAIKKLKRIKPILIGITGSYGKTSTKNYLYQLLSQKYRVCKTPKSYNTYLGVLKSINEDMSENCEIMIIELGVDKINGFDKALSFLEFDYSIITSIGAQHLKTFKTLDNIVKEKSKILDKTKKIIFLNYNYEYLRMLNKEKYVPIISYSYYSDSDIYIENLKLENDRSKFILNYLNNKYDFSTNILGKHQIENLMGCIGLSLYLGIDIKHIQRKVQHLYNEKNRMEIKSIDNIKVIDDSYNSNINGFKAALDVLGLQVGYKVLITPGVIELGAEWEEKNRELGKYAIGLVDYVVLVGENVTRPFYLGLTMNGFSEDNILIVDSFKEGMDYLKQNKKNIVLLIENDLPDFYLK